MELVEIEATSFLDFVDLVEGMAGYIFRGQSNWRWPLVTSLERELDGYGKTVRDLREYERLMLERFKQRYHLYAENPPSNDDHIEWLALMQHYGAATRLLDFSLSPYVAAYFAVIGANDKNNSVVWAINRPILREKYIGVSGRVYHENNPYGYFDRSKILSNSGLINEEISSDKLNISSHYVLDVESKRPSIRVVRQQGLFVSAISFAGLNSNFSFFDCLCNTLEIDLTPKSQDHVSLLSTSVCKSKGNKDCVKVVIPAKLRTSFLRQLSLMCIDSESLFPDLSGLAQHQLVRYAV